MKTRALIPFSILFFTAAAVFADALITIAELQKTNSSATAPVQVSSSTVQFKRATFYGKKAARTDNTGNVWIGFSSTNDTQMALITSGGSVVIEAPDGYFYDMTNIWLDVATTNDGVMVIYSNP